MKFRIAVAAAMMPLALSGCNRAPAATPPPPTQPAAWPTVDANLQRCPMHGDSMKPDTVPIAYGLMAGPYLSARRNSFPHANSSVLGGCEVLDVKTAPVKYCSTCRKAEQEWHRSGGN